MRDVKPLLKKAWAKWVADDCPRMGAALSYYTVFAMVPFLLLSMAFLGTVLGQDEVQNRIMTELTNLLGEQPAKALENIIFVIKPRTVGVVAAVLGVVTLIFAASGIMVELKTALNRIWGEKARRGGFMFFIENRLVSGGLVMGAGFLFMISIIGTTAVAALGAYLGHYFPIPPWLLELVNFITSFIVVTVMFGFLYKLLPDAPVKWSSIRIGALIAATFFALGRLLIGFYIGQSTFHTVYGTGGSFLVLLCWVYYSSQIFYFGAEIVNINENVNLPTTKA